MSNNLRNLTVRIPKGVLTCFTGVAGSGKSSLAAELSSTPSGADRQVAAEAARWSSSINAP